MSDAPAERTEDGSTVLASWTDKYGTDWQFLQDEDWLGVRYEQDGEWLYLGDWLDHSEDLDNEDAVEERQWTEQARENVAKWGQQPPAELVLALSEELAEVCEEILTHADPGDGAPPVGDYDDRPHRGRELLADQQELGFEVRDYLEDAFEDDNGQPIPVEDRPAIAGDIRDVDAVREEVDDLGPLAIQMRWSLDEERGRDE